MFTVCVGGLGGAGEGGSARPTVSVFIIALKESRSSVRSGHLHVITERPPLSWHGCSFGPESARMAWPGVGRAARQALPEDPPRPEVLQSLGAEARVPTGWSRGCPLLFFPECGAASGRREAQAPSDEIDDPGLGAAFLFLTSELLEGRVPTLPSLRLQCHRCWGRGGPRSVLERADP